MPTRKWKSEFLVNASDLVTTQQLPSVAALSNGGFVIGWQDEAPADTVIRVQVYDAAGVGGATFVVNPSTSGDQAAVSLVGISGANSPFWAVQQDPFATEFDVSGAVYTAVGGLVRAQNPNNSSPSIHKDPDTASLGANGAVAVWRDDGTIASPSLGDIRMRGFNADGSQRFVEFTVNTNAGGSLAAAQAEPAVAANPAGSHIAVVWRDDGLNGGDIRAGVFNSTGAQVTPEFTVNSVTASTQLNPDVAWLDNGRFVVAWTSFVSPPSLDSDQTAVQYAIYNVSGALLGTERLANSTVTGFQQQPAVTALPDGGFVIAWADLSATGGDSSGCAIRLQVFDGVGDKRGGEMLVNTSTTLDQSQVSLATLADGRVVVTWSDGFGAEVRAQIVDPRDGIVTGTSAGETLYGHDFVNDEISAGAGDDILFGLGGDDALYGGEGSDQFFVNNAGDQVFEVIGSGVDRVFAAISYALAAGQQIEELNTVDANATTAINLTGNEFGQSIAGNAGANVLDGGGGSDTVSYAASLRGVIIDLASQSTWDGVANDTLVSIENATGSAFDDRLDSNSLANRLDGGGGTDTVSYASSGSGVIIDMGSLSTWDGTVNDTLISIENATGSSRNDDIRGTSGDNVLDGGAGGADTINGFGGTDTASYASSLSGVIIDLGSQSSWDGTSGDSLISMENAIGSRFNDDIRGTGGNNVLDGGAGGADIIFGGNGSDTVSYASSLSGVIIDLGSQSTWDGTSGDSLISMENATGSRFNDDIRGTGGNNVLDGAGGVDIFLGGNGNDTFVFRRGEANGDSVADFAGNGAAAGDQFQFVGYGSAGAGATFTQVDATHWKIHSADGLVDDIITLANGASVHATDFSFI